MQTAVAEGVAATRQKYYETLAPQSLAPLWEVLKGLVPTEPRSKFAPHVWQFAKTKPLLMAAGDLLTAEEAERRVLVLENPAMPGGSRITATMYAGLQLIMPGEIAPAHRHTASAHGARRQWRLHRRGWREDRDEAWRFHHHPQHGLA